MINNEARAHESAITDSKKTSRIRKRRWAKHLRFRAAKIKKQLQAENSFHKAMCEMSTTSDRYRQSYLHWILNNMFSLFSYETGLQAINDNAAYDIWLSANSR
jgi:hypothetical protein